MQLTNKCISNVNRRMDSRIAIALTLISWLGLKMTNFSHVRPRMEIIWKFRVPWQTYFSRFSITCMNPAVWLEISKAWSIWAQHWVFRHIYSREITWTVTMHLRASPSGSWTYQVQNIKRYIYRPSVLIRVHTISLHKNLAIICSGWRCLSIFSKLSKR